MDPQTLVDQDIAGGKLLVEALERKGVFVRVAYWRRTEDEPGWRLRLSTERYETVGPLGLYSLAMDAMQELNDSRTPKLGSVEFVSLTHREAVELRYFAGTPDGPFLGGELMTGTRIGDAYFAGVYVYRAEQLPAWDAVVSVHFATRSGAAWVSLPGSLTFRDGLLVDVVCDEVEVRKKVVDGRLKARFVLAENEQHRGGIRTGTLTRYEYEYGRLWQRDARSRRVKLRPQVSASFP